MYYVSWYTGVINEPKMSHKIETNLRIYLDSFSFFDFQWHQKLSSKSSKPSKSSSWVIKVIRVIKFTCHQSHQTHQSHQKSLIDVIKVIEIIKFVKVIPTYIPLSYQLIAYCQEKSSVSTYINSATRIWIYTNKRDLFTTMNL